MSIPKTCKAFVLENPSASGHLQQIPIELPQRGEILIKVHACGVCSGDVMIMSGVLGSLVKYPLIPGHEIVGTIVAVGEEEKRWEVGDLVGGGYHGGHDGTCRSCNSGFFQMCEKQFANGLTKAGGYAEYTILRTEATVRLPTHLDRAAMAPLMCAGVTLFNGIRRMNIKQGGLVAIQGLGGLGHLGIQYARKMGYQTVALSSSDKKREFAKELGATAYIDTSKEDVVEALQKMGGADLIAVTAPSTELVPLLVKALAPMGKLLILAAIGEVSINLMDILFKGCSIVGWPSGHALDSQEAVQFADIQGVNCMVEKFSLDNAQEAIERMKSGDVRFRCVLVMD